MLLLTLAWWLGSATACTGSLGGGGGGEPRADEGVALADAGEGAAADHGPGGAHDGAMGELGLAPDAADPCAGVSCTTPPADTCDDASTLLTYAASGSCSAGSCSYPATKKSCPFGCAGGACTADPCAGVSCNSPPPSKCLNDTWVRTYAKTGTCSDGSCSYTHTDERCPARCVGKACEPVYGWDYNIYHRCVTSIHTGKPNFYSDKTDCPVKGKHWVTSVNAERSLGQQCSGVQDQALPINVGGPLRLNWQSHTDEFGRKNRVANIKSDFMTYPHPCGSGVYTFLAFWEYLYAGGGPFPTPNKLIYHVNVRYDDWTPNGAARAVAFFAGEWNGKGVWLEIDLASKNWGDAYSAADIVQVYKSSSFLWVEMYGPAMGLSLPRKSWTKFNINWHSIIPNLVSRGYLEAPTGGLSQAKTVGLGMATEVRNVGSTGVVAEMWITDVRPMTK